MAEWRGYEPVSALQLEYSLVERQIEHEFVPLGIAHDMGIMVWSPLASGFLSGKYRAQDGAASGSGRLEVMAGSTNPAFAKATERNWTILLALEEVAAAVGRPMAEVALSWVVNRPGVASVIVGATRKDQLEANLRALALELPADLTAKLDTVSKPGTTFPYSFFDGEIQSMVHGGAMVGGKPPSYAQTVAPNAAAAGR
ncbi:MAG: aldo/keto reductase [Pseudomonadota bacterium]